MAVATVKRIEGLLGLLRANLPRPVQSGGEFTDWNVVAPALIAIAGDLFEGIQSLPPPRGRLRAEVLARSLAEYVIGFAWLAASKDEAERARLLAVFEKDEFLEREKSENKLNDQIAGRPAYHSLFESRFPKALLDETTRSRLTKHKAEESIRRAPDALSMACTADSRWMDEIDLVRQTPFALIYFTMFVGSSFMTHPSVSAVARMVLGSPPDLVVGAAEPLGLSEAPYGVSLIALVNMLLVSSHALGWPDEVQVRAVLLRE